MANYRGPSMPGQVMSAVALLIAVAVGARVAYVLLAPLLPSLVALLLVSFILVSVFRRR